MKRFPRFSRRLSFGVVTLSLMLLTAGCKKDEGPGPDTNCNGTGTLHLTNTGSVGKRVVIDGIDHGYLSAGNSMDVSVTAGMSHSLTFKYSNGNTACNTAYPSVPKCGTYNISCGG